RPRGRHVAHRGRALRRLLGLAVAVVLTLPSEAWARPKQPLVEAREALASWNLGQADKLLSAPAPPRDALERQLLLARLGLQRSRFAAVVARLTPLVAKHADAYEARVLLGRALVATGQRE